MHNSFVKTQENRHDRYFGGTSKGVADPYISGYHFIHFKHLPPNLSAHLAVNDPADLGFQEGPQGNDEIARLLAASCLSVTPVGGTLNRAEFTGLGGTKWSVPTNIDYGNTLSMRFLEYSRLPILHVFNNWFRMIREYRNGTSLLTGSAKSQTSIEYTKSAYSGTLLYWTTKPDGVTVEYAACYTGVYPTKDPQELYAGDIASSDKLEVDMEFSFDMPFMESWVRKECQFMANLYHGEGIKAHGGYKVGTSTANNTEEGSHTDSGGIGTATSPA